MSTPGDAAKINGLLAEFRDWALARVTPSMIVSEDDVDELLHQFLASKGATDPAVHLGSIKAIKEGSLHQSIVNEFFQLGARIKKQDGDGVVVDILERYRKVPLHAIFLYTSEDKHIANYILHNWGALDSLSGRHCDLHPTVDQFASVEDAYDFVEKLDVVRDAGFRSFSKLPGLFFWNLNAESEYIPFGVDANENDIKNVLRVVFEEISKEPLLQSIRKAKERLQKVPFSKVPEAVTVAPLWKDLIPFAVVFVIILGSIGLAAIWVSPLVIGIVLIASMLVFILIGIFVSRHRDLITEGTLVNIVSQVIRQLPLLRSEKNKAKAETDESDDPKTKSGER